MNYRIFAILWWFISLPAVYLLWRDPHWLKAPPGLPRLQALRLEQWVALALVLIQLLLLLRIWALPRESRYKRCPPPDKSVGDRNPNVP